MSCNPSWLCMPKALPTNGWDSALQAICDPLSLGSAEFNAVLSVCCRDRGEGKPISGASHPRGDGWSNVGTVSWRFVIQSLDWCWVNILHVHDSGRIPMRRNDDMFIKVSLLTGSKELNLESLFGVHLPFRITRFGIADTGRFVNIWSWEDNFSMSDSFTAFGSKEFKGTLKYPWPTSHVVLYVRTFRGDQASAFSNWAMDFLFSLIGLLLQFHI